MHLNYIFLLLLSASNNEEILLRDEIYEISFKKNWLGKNCYNLVIKSHFLYIKALISIFDHSVFKLYRLMPA